MEVKASSALVDLCSNYLHTPPPPWYVLYSIVYAIALAPLERLVYGSCNADRVVKDASAWYVVHELATRLHLHERGADGEIYSNHEVFVYAGGY